MSNAPGRVYRKEPRWTNVVEVPVPIRDRHLTGVHWWDPDRIRHLDDMPKFCPSCGAAVVENGGLCVEYWEGERRIYHTWCHECRWTGDITRVTRMIGHEAEH